MILDTQLRYSVMGTCIAKAQPRLWTDHFHSTWLEDTHLQAKKYQVFVSSTYTDLIEERREAIEAILDLDHIPAGMEGFPAIDMEQFKYIQRVIDQCDYYVLLVGARYGSVANDGKSFTEKEYRYAVERGKVVIALAMHADLIAALPPERLESNAASVPKLDAFREEVMDGRMGFIWAKPNDIFRGVTKALRAAFEEFPREGWIRASAAASEEVLSQINDLRIKNELLQQENNTLRNQLSPAVGDMAPLDSQYDLKFTYRSGYNQTVNSSIKMTWREIFVGVAPKLSVPQAPEYLAAFLQRYLKESGRSSHVGIKLNSVTADQIRIQLGAYGLIKEIRGKNTNGGLGEWLQITELGDRVMKEAMVVKAKQA